MSRELRILPEAEAELMAAAEWYESMQPGLGVAFVEAVDRAFEGISDACVAQARILAGHPSYEIPQLIWRSWSPGLSLLASIVLLGNELSVPSENGVWRDDATQLVQCLPPEGVPLHGEATPLVIGEADALVAELLTQRAVRSLEILDDLELFPVDPAGENHQAEVPGRHGNHDGTLVGRVHAWGPKRRGRGSSWPAAASWSTASGRSTTWCRTRPRRPARSNCWAGSWLRSPRWA